MPHCAYRPENVFSAHSPASFQYAIGSPETHTSAFMDNIVYLAGVVVINIAVLSFFGLR